MSSEEIPSVRLRSIYVSPTDDTRFSVDSEAQAGGSVDTGIKRKAARAPGNCSIVDHFCADYDPDKNDPPVSSDADERDNSTPLRLPESTHSLLFMEKVFSLPYWFAIAIVVISFGCLALTLNNALEGGSPGNPFGVPVNVTTSVRLAQYLSILITLLMEEEIPTGLFLLREIQKKDFQKKLPQKKYWKFIFSAAIRMLSGYLFLLNVFVVLIQATGVIEIFYDVLALQFVQHLDDIAFSLAKMEVLGATMQRACTGFAFRVEFEKQKSHCKKSKAFLKLLYFFNLGALLAGMLVVTMEQVNGSFQCNSITVNFSGDRVWEHALAFDAESGEWDDWTLVFSYFSGVYESTGKSSGRPVYKERRKYDRAPYELQVPAEIRYCKAIKAWVFTHEHIRKSHADESDCNWLLRSPETEEFDLLDVPTNWQIWTGVISTTEVFTACNECSAATDCNLNGQCVDGHCKCDRKAGAQYLGMHCETKLEDECRTIISETENHTFSVDYYSSSPNGDGELSLFQQYSRPVYEYIMGTSEVPEHITKDDFIWMVYTGSRWFGTVYNLEELGLKTEEFIARTKEFHAFWDRAYSEVTDWVSDPTKASSPVGVDWYVVGEKGSQFGPFGNLIPVQLYNQTGRGYFRCAGDYIPPKRRRGSDE